MVFAVVLLACAAGVSALSAPAATSAAAPPSAATLARGAFVRGAGAAALALASAPATAATTTASGLQYEVLKSNPKGVRANVGDLIAIRFRGQLTDGKVFDDITETPEPLYYRVGGGNLIKGIDEALLLMHYGEKYNVLIPPDLAFGDKGRSPSAGKPRIPGGASIYYEISFVGFPGFEGDLFLMNN